eukprot:Em0004g961a
MAGKAVIPTLYEQETEGLVDPLDVKCTPEHLYDIAVLNFDWKVVGKRLLNATYVNDIDMEEGSEQRKRDRMVEKWLEIKGPRATYRAILTVFEKLSNRQAAEAVRNLVVQDANDLEPMLKKLKTNSDESSYSSMEVSCDGQQTISGTSDNCIVQNVFVNDQKQQVSGDNFQTFGGTSDACNVQLTNGEKQQANYTLNKAYSPRAYQNELAQPGIEGKNYIISLPTGAGKTLIAGMIIANHLQKNPDGKVIFTVPKEHLAQQQQIKLEEYIQGIKVESVTGRSGKNIYPLVDSTSVNVIVCTMGKLRHEMCEGSLKVKQFTLMIVDECHHVIGNSTGVDVMKQYLAEKILKQSRNLPQVVGMSASLGAGKSPSFDKALNHQIDICAQLDSIYGVRKVEANTSELTSCINTPDINLSLMTPLSADEPFIEILEREMGKLEAMINENPTALKGSEEYQKWVQNEKLAAELSTIPEDRDRNAVLEHLLSYSSALDAYIIFSPESAKDILDSACVFPEDTATTRERELNYMLIKVKRDLKSFTCTKNPMLQGLEDLIYQQYKSGCNSRGILFVATIEGTKYVCKWIANSSLLKPLVQAKSIVSFSRGGMTKSDQQCAIDAFKSGIFNLLVSTSVLEEGLDVPECNFIIRYQYISNEISHRQAMGRARAKDSKMYIIITKGSNMPYHQMLQQEKLKLADRATERLHDISRDSLMFSHILEEKQREIIERHQRNEQVASLQHKEWPDSSKVKLLCKNCKIEACRGSDVYMFGSSASPNYVVPRKDFERCYEKIRKIEEADNIYGGLVKLYKMLCRECKKDWGIIGWWKDVGLELPVLKGKSFTLQYDDKTKPLQQWKKAPFEILPYATFTDESVDLQED